MCRAWSVVSRGLSLRASVCAAAACQLTLWRVSRLSLLANPRCAARPRACPGQRHGGRRLADVACVSAAHFTYPPSDSSTVSQCRCRRIVAIRSRLQCRGDAPLPCLSRSTTLAGPLGSHRFKPCAPCQALPCLISWEHVLVPLHFNLLGPPVCLSTTWQQQGHRTS